MLAWAVPHLEGVWFAFGSSAGPTLVGQSWARELSSPNQTHPPGAMTWSRWYPEAVRNSLWGQPWRHSCLVPRTAGTGVRGSMFHDPCSVLEF